MEDILSAVALFSTMGENHDKCGDILSTVGDIMSAVGIILSTFVGVQYHGGRS